MGVRKTSRSPTRAFIPSLSDWLPFLPFPVTNEVTLLREVLIDKRILTRKETPVLFPELVRSERGHSLGLFKC